MLVIIITIIIIGNFGDWGLGIGDWANPQIPNPQSPFYIIRKETIN